MKDRLPLADRARDRHRRCALVDADNLDIAADLDAQRARPGHQRIGQRAHSADRHQPFPGAAADQVIEKASIRQQFGVEQRGVRADHRVGGDHTADRVVAEPPDDRFTDGLLDDIGPDLLPGRRDHRIPGGRPALQRAAQHWRENLCHGMHLGVELLPVLIFGGRPGQFPERFLGDRARMTLHQQSTRDSVPADRGVRRDRTGREGQLDAEPADQLVRQQRDQIGIPAQPGGMRREQPRGDRGPAGLVGAFQHRHRLTGLSRENRRHQPVVPAADDDHVGARHWHQLLCRPRSR